MQLEVSKEYIILRLLEYRSIDPIKGCWIWNGYCNDICGTGYGKMSFKSFNKTVSLFTHRLSAYVFKDFNLDPKIFICHDCDNPPCFNPDHLFEGTIEDNNLDRFAKGRSTGGNRKYSVKMVEEMHNDLKLGMSRYSISLKYKVPYPYCTELLKRRDRHGYQRKTIQ